MTNAEKYLKDGVIDDFVFAFDDFCAMQTSNQAGSVRLAQFLSRTTKPTLTEEEKTILRHISKEYTEIGRDDKEELYLVEMVDTIHSGKYCADIFADDVFAFIKAGEQYEIKELLKDD